MSGLDLGKVKKVLENVKGLENVVVYLVNPTPEMEEFAKLEEFGVKVEVQEDGGEPAIILQRDGISITYNAAPLQMEFEPFLRTLSRLAEMNSGLSDENVKKLEGCKAEVIVFVAPFCPHCAKVVEIANKMAIANPDIKVRIVDVSVLPDLGGKYGVTSAPTVIINGEIKLVGELSENELVEWVAKANKDYKLDYIVTLLREGRIDEVREMVERNPEDLDVLGDVLKQPEIMARVGAMVLLERLFREDPEKVRAVKEKIMKLLQSEDSTVLQDAAFILGKIGEKKDISALESLLKSEDSDVREAAKEAIEEIEGRN
ncbi:thioredoxin family protein [Archaeoglobus veneficus]|uniref:Glutaredoxin n=1 Tax=Archaeoglobus veneficus (strain DSM 11195 / SNP6) TaxID=693661 RepID=F2KQ61_ARCVS|nr:thioredoxin family protein [Archaeoglobus veneficus]AEA47664.1 glutaredoxin [Archaeoglobus veneficus SNP6]